MATIDLLPRKEFAIVLEDGVRIPGKFGTWALKRFSDKRGHKSLPELQEALGQMSLSDAVDYLLSAVEQYFRQLKTKDSFPYTDLDACDWIDQLGGIASADMQRLFGHAGGDEEKKTATEP